MSTLSGHGIRAQVPAGSDARIYRRSEEVVGVSGIQSVQQAGGTTHAVLHAASFPLPVDRGDFGGGAVELMRTDDLLVVLIEFHPDAASTALFRGRGLPRQLDHRAFSTNSLQRQLPGQAGTQVFFNHAGRAWCLYVVLGSYVERTRLVPQVNA